MRRWSWSASSGTTQRLSILSNFDVRDQRSLTTRSNSAWSTPKFLDNTQDTWLRRPRLRTRGRSAASRTPWWQHQSGAKCMPLWCCGAGIARKTPGLSTYMSAQPRVLWPANLAKTSRTPGVRRPAAQARQAVLPFWRVASSAARRKQRGHASGRWS